ncbi:uncharacterized protein Dvar_81850 [Desulfosarcina variabilis str. Montpellier]|uniref:hypothetical protein n=1 Tax=Desulfosarcina variabilis TaxID=2300 RepID=UPI003AFAA68C
MGPDDGQIGGGLSIIRTVSKTGFRFKIKAAPCFEPQAYTLATTLLMVLGRAKTKSLYFDISQLRFYTASYQQSAVLAFNANPQKGEAAP